MGIISISRPSYRRHWRVHAGYEKYRIETQSMVVVDSIILKFVSNYYMTNNNMDAFTDYCG